MEFGTMKRCWVARTRWKSCFGETITIFDTRQEARNYKRNMLQANLNSVVEKITIHKAQDFKSGRFYISGKVHY